jgi:hypothetical protein
MEKKIAIILIAASLACSCSPKVIEHVRTEYVYRDRIQRDTTFVHDSTYIKEYVKGDSVKIIEYRERYKYLYKYINKTDTVAVHDTLSVEKVREVKVERKLSWWQKLRLVLFPVMLLGLLWAYRKEIIGIIKKIVMLI